MMNKARRILEAKGDLLMTVWKVTDPEDGHRKCNKSQCPQSINMQCLVHVLLVVIHVKARVFLREWVDLAQLRHPLAQARFVQRIIVQVISQPQDLLMRMFYDMVYQTIPSTTHTIMPSTNPLPLLCKSTSRPLAWERPIWNTMVPRAWHQQIKNFMRMSRPELQGSGPLQVLSTCLEVVSKALSLLSEAHSEAITDSVELVPLLKDSLRVSHSHTLVLLQG